MAGRQNSLPLRGGRVRVARCTLSPAPSPLRKCRVRPAHHLFPANGVLGLIGSGFQPVPVRCPPPTSSFIWRQLGNRQNFHRSPTCLRPFPPPFRAGRGRKPLAWPRPAPLLHRSLTPPGGPGPAGHPGSFPVDRPACPPKKNRRRRRRRRVLKAIIALGLQGPKFSTLPFTLACLPKRRHPQ
jgi:hypothetical protein